MKGLRWRKVHKFCSRFECFEVRRQYIVTSRHVESDIIHEHSFKILHHNHKHSCHNFCHKQKQKEKQMGSKEREG